MLSGHIVLFYQRICEKKKKQTKKKYQKYRKNQQKQTKPKETNA